MRLTSSTILPGAGRDRRVPAAFGGCPAASDGPIVVGAIALGIGGTDREIVAGAGPIGLLAAQRGLEVHVLDVVEEGPKPALVGQLGATTTRRRGGRAALAKADRGWLGRLVNRRVPLGRWADALERRPDDIKVTIDLGGS